jgi:hypothetical protein
VFTWVTVHRVFLPGYADRVPYVTALVELVEDPRVRLATFLRDVPASGLRVGPRRSAFGARSALFFLIDGLGPWLRAMWSPTHLLRPIGRVL